MASTSAGKLATVIRQVTSIDHVKIGIRSSVIPGARRPAMVASWQAARAMPASAASATPAHHRSMPGPGVRTAADCGYSAVHAAEPAPLRVRKPDHITRPPSTSSQKPMRFSRGQAISRAPICNGTRYMPSASAAGVTKR